ncbi:MAG: hypothetical protein JXR63_05210 [Spirochaetales bacterium]|nr:hypothetical protein [Spirochaetales bacterium]
MKKSLICFLFIIFHCFNLYSNNEIFSFDIPKSEEKQIKAINMPLILPLGYFEKSLGFSFGKRQVENLIAKVNNEHVTYALDLGYEVLNNISNIKYTFSDHWQWNFLLGFTWSSMNNKETQDEDGNLFFPIKKAAYSVSFNFLDINFRSIYDFPFVPLADLSFLNFSTDFRIKYRYSEKSWGIISFYNKFSSFITSPDNYSLGYVGNFAFFTGFQLSDTVSMDFTIANGYAFSYGTNFTNDIINSGNSHIYFGSITLGIEGTVNASTRIRFEPFYGFILKNTETNVQSSNSILLEENLSFSPLGEVGFNFRVIKMWQKKADKV